MPSAYDTSASPAHQLAPSGTPASVQPRADRPAVLLTGPPWPRSGSARLFQNQVDYYRSRGFSTIFLFSPVHSSFVPDHPDWPRIQEGIQEIGADHMAIAPINHARFARSKYTAWVKQGFRGTALDWVVNTGRSAEPPAEILQLLASHPIALVHINHVFSLGFARQMLRRIPGAAHIPVILETHDIQSHLLHVRKDINPWTHRYDSVDALVRSELAHLKKVKTLLHCSVDDYKFFSAELPHNRHILALPTVDENFAATVRNASPALPPIDFLFVGQATDINFSAIEWLLEKVWSLLASEGHSLKILGPLDAMVRERRPDLHARFDSYFLGAAGDLVPYYRAARCVIAPMVSGTGISIKTIEALGLGKPFVGTSKAYRGMPMDRIERAGLRPHDAPASFAAAMRNALAGESAAAAASSAVYNDLFSKQAAFASRDSALQAAGVAQPAAIAGGIKGK
jgi:glycosyltransferase involved in cell wall biosynthesis